MKVAKAYQIREISWAEYRKLSAPLAKKIFADRSLIFHLQPYLSKAEQKKSELLGKRLSANIFRLVLAVFHRGKIVGWSAGYQMDRFSFYMMNSAVDPKHRRQGIYSLLLKQTMERVLQEGFQEITSRHNSTNNNVIIPKLKAGFVIKSLEISDTFGALVHLSYFPNRTRREVMDFRSGEKRLSPRLKKKLNF